MLVNRLYFSHTNRKKQMRTITYTIKYSPKTGDEKPYEVWVTSEATGHKHCSSSKTLKGAEKSRKGYAEPRKAFHNVITPEYEEI